MTLEIHAVKGGKLEKVRYILHEFDDGVTAQFRIDIDRSLHEVKSSSKAATFASKVGKSKLCPHAVDTIELDFVMLDKWVFDNSVGLWYRGGFKTYHFQDEEDAVFFKLTWGSVGT